MKTAVLILALFALLQGPVCPMRAMAVPAPAAVQDGGHGCCQDAKAPGSAPAPEVPAQQDDGAAMAVCAAHCAALIQAVSVLPVQAQAVVQAAEPALPVPAIPPAFAPGFVAALHPDGIRSPRTIPLLI